MHKVTTDYVHHGKNILSFVVQWFPWLTKQHKFRKTWGRFAPGMAATTPKSNQNETFT